MKEVVPLGRMGRKWDIAMAVLYLTSEAGRSFTLEGHSTMYEL